MSEYPPGFSPFLERMKGEGLPDLFIQTFAHYYGQLSRGETGLRVLPHESHVLRDGADQEVRVAATCSADGA